MPGLDILLDQVEASRDDILALEQALVRIQTVNTGIHAHGKRDPCVWICKRLAGPGRY